MMSIIHRMSRRFPTAVLQALMEMPVIEEATLKNKTDMQGIIDALQVKLNEVADQTVQYSCTVVQEGDQLIWIPAVQIIHHGVTHNYLINKELFISSEYRKLMELGKKLMGFLQSDAKVIRGEKQQAVTTFAEAADWLLSEAKKGQIISRYKGLGEMNPEQLWETTMDPEVRRMLQVRIEDAVAADQIFTTLMGDQVEPRRAFIEANALKVSNLDI